VDGRVPAPRLGDKVGRGLLGDFFYKYV